MSLSFPFVLITPNCPDGYRFTSADSLLRFLADNYPKFDVKITYNI